MRDFQAYRTDPEVGRWQGWQIMTGAQALAFLAEMHRAPLFEPGRWVQLGIALREPDVPGGEPGQLVGDIGLVLDAGDPARAEIGFTLNARWQGRGLASEAVAEARRLVFDCTAARTLQAVTDARNVGSVRLLERLGFRRLETMQAIFRGEPCLEHRYASERGDP